MKTVRRSVLMFLALVVTYPILAAPAEQPPWQQRIEMCVASTGTDTDCLEQYVAVEQFDCLAPGVDSKRCLIEKATTYILADDSQCDDGFKVIMVCQCHSAVGRQLLLQAGPAAVCAYIKEKYPQTN